jgi:hypothetical protein
MTRTIKAAVLLMCFLVCALAAFFSPKDTAKDTETRTHVVPVNNQQSHRGIWLRV